MIWSIIIMPMYTSEVVLGLEKNFLTQAFEHLRGSWRQACALSDGRDGRDGRDGLNHDGRDDDVKMESIEAGAGTSSSPTSNLLAELLADVDSITKLRIGSFKAFAKEITLNSLDKRELQFVKLNLIPLPPSVRLVVRDLAAFGSMVSASCKALYLGLTTPDASHDAARNALREVLADVIRPTDELIDATGVLVGAIGSFLAEQREERLGPSGAHRAAVAEAVQAVSDARSRLASAFETAARPKIVRAGGGGASGATLKILAYYAFCVRALYCLEAMGRAIVDVDGYSDRDGWLTFWSGWIR